MPFVHSYFRRSAGAAAADTGPKRQLDVAIYGSDGINLLRDRYGARYMLSGLSFSTGLPGGFLQASFVLTLTDAWAGRVGNVVTIRRGLKILWWGWIEDFTRRTTGTRQELSVVCLGPWQILQQRLCSPNYSVPINSEGVLVEKMRLYCSEISHDFSNVAQTGINVNPFVWSNKTISDLVKLVCESGDSTGKQMLFALWEPRYLNRNSYPANLLTNGDMELGVTTWTLNTNDELYSGNEARIYSSPTRSIALFNASPSTTAAGDLRQTITGIVPGTTYVVDYRVCHENTHGYTITAHVKVSWLKTDNSYISESVTVHTYNGTAGGWQHYVDTATAPALAAKAIVRLYVSIPYTSYQDHVYWDDVYMFALGASAEIDRKPRAYLWAKDLSGYDYSLHTRRLDTAAPITESTRELWNDVAASYGSTTSYTAFATDAASIAAYRDRKTVVSAGSVSSTVATAVRDAYLAAQKNPRVDVGSLTVTPGALSAAGRRLVDPVEVRAGQRILIADGQNSGSVFLVASTSYQDGTMTITPESTDDAGMLLARRG